MAQTETNPNFQMIHIASELVALVGLTFYFTSKHNTLNAEIKKLQGVVQQQHGKIQQMEKQMKDMFQNIQKLEITFAKMKKPMDQQLPNFPQFDDPTEVFAQMMGVPPFFPTDIPNHSQHASNDRDIQIIDEDSPNSKKSPNPPVNPDDGMETDSQLDDQLADEFAELKPDMLAAAAAERAGALQPPVVQSKSKSARPSQPSQPARPSQPAQPKQDSSVHQVNLQKTTNPVDELSRNTKIGKLKPIQQQQQGAVLIDFGNSDLNERSPSNNSQLSIQDE